MQYNTVVMGLLVLYKVNAGSGKMTVIGVMDRGFTVVVNKFLGLEQHQHHLINVGS
jgi:hypothetical protein